MPFRKFTSIPNDPNFREALLLWARTFVRSEAIARRVAQRTIDVLCDNPNLLIERDINKAIFSLLRRHALDEAELPSENDLRDDDAISEKQPMC